MHSSPSFEIVHAYVIDVRPRRSTWIRTSISSSKVQNLVELGLDVLAREVPPLVERHRAAHERGLRELGPAERVREVDPPACVGLDPGDPQPLDVLDGRHGTSP